jgi:predicted amidophosphoribosyltransferase
MFCLSCTMPCSGSLCVRCRIELRPAPEVSIGPGLVGVAGFVHEGSARRLVHALKYRAVFAAAEPLADAMAENIPGSATALVPVPRATLRAFRHGIDPAAVLAAEVSLRTGLPIVEAIKPRWWWRRHAGRSRDERSAVPFAPTGSIVPKNAALVDDVLTTGATARAAAAALEGLPTLVLVATCASRMDTGESPFGGVVTVQPFSGLTDGSTLRARTTNAGRFNASGRRTAGHSHDGEEHE